MNIFGNWLKMKGELLQVAIQNSGIKIKELERLTGIPERTIYSLYLRPMVKQKYLEKIAAAGVDLQNTTLPKPQADQSSEDTLKRSIGLLESMMKILNERFEVSDRQSDAIIKSNEHIRQDARFYRDIVQKAVKAGAVRIDPVKSPAKTTN